MTRLLKSSLSQPLTDEEKLEDAAERKAWRFFQADDPKARILCFPPVMSPEEWEQEYGSNGKERSHSE